MHQHTLNRIALATAAASVLVVGIAVGMAAGRLPKTETVRILRIGAVLEQSGATTQAFEHAGALIDAGLIQDAEKMAQERRMR